MGDIIENESVAFKLKYITNQLNSIITSRKKAKTVCSVDFWLNENGLKVRKNKGLLRQKS